MYRFNVIHSYGEFVCIGERLINDLYEDLRHSEWFRFKLEDGGSILIKTSEIKVILFKDNE